MIALSDAAVQAAEEQSADLEWTVENYAATNPDMLNSLAYEGTCESLFLDGNIYSVSISYYSCMGGPQAALVTPEILAAVSEGPQS